MEEYDIYSQEEARAKAKEARELALLQRKDDVLWLMGQPQGRRYVWDLLDACGFWRSSYLGGSRDDMLVREGARNIALRAVAELRDVCPNYWIKMLEENQ